MNQHIRYTRYWEINHSLRRLLSDVYAGRTMVTTTHEMYHESIHEIYNILIRPASSHPMTNYKIHPWVIPDE